MILSTQTGAPAWSDTPMPVLFMFICCRLRGFSKPPQTPPRGSPTDWDFFFLPEYTSLKILLFTENNESIHGFSSRDERHGGRNHLYRCSQRRISMCSYECKAEMSTWEKLLGPYQSLHGSIPHHTHSSPINMSVPNESRICKLTHNTSLISLCWLRLFVQSTFWTISGQSVLDQECCSE